MENTLAFKLIINYKAQLDKVKGLKRKKEQLSDRRSHASQLRMKSIANLASDAPQQKRRRRGQDGNYEF